jgi:hypothetical protein
MMVCDAQQPDAAASGRLYHALGRDVAVRRAVGMHMQVTARTTRLTASRAARRSTGDRAAGAGDLSGKDL